MLESIDIDPLGRRVAHVTHAKEYIGAYSCTLSTRHWSSDASLTFANLENLDRPYSPRVVTAVNHNGAVRMLDIFSATESELILLNTPNFESIQELLNCAFSFTMRCPQNVYVRA